MAAPIYTYTPNTPQASQPFDQSQPEILGNFQAINELINVNHIGFNTPDTFGKHNFISMPDQVTAPTTSASEMALFSQATPTGSNASELFIKYPENGLTTGITEQIANSSTVAAATLYDGNSYTYLAGTVAIVFPSGYMIKFIPEWDVSYNGPSIVYNTIDYVTGLPIPPFKNIPNVIVTNIIANNSSGRSNCYAKDNTQTSFTPYGGGSVLSYSTISFGF